MSMSCTTAKWGKLQKLCGAGGRRRKLVSVLFFRFRVLVGGRVGQAGVGEGASALGALDKDFGIIFTKPNADNDGRVIIRMIDEFVSGSAGRAVACTSLGQLLYLSAISHVDAVVGNSSSGLYEVPSFGKPTVNIGDRQRGRLRAASVIDCASDRTSIREAVDETQFTLIFGAAPPQVTIAPPAEGLVPPEGLLFAEELPEGERDDLSLLLTGRPAPTSER